MKQKLPVGKSDFKKVREENCYYIDKTFLIREIIDSAHEVILLPRPRRFGKTLNLSMLRYFFEKTEKNLKELFNGTMIQSDEVFAEHHARYPLIFLTFKDLKTDTWDSMCRGIINLISDEYLRHVDLLKSANFSSVEKRYIESIIQKDADSGIIANPCVI